MDYGVTCAPMDIHNFVILRWKLTPMVRIIRSIIVDQFGDEELYNNMSYSWKDYHGKDSSFWAHEYNKHGTCFSTIKPSCYLSKLLKPKFI